MSKARNNNLPQHDMDQGHYGELTLNMMPSATSLPSGTIYVWDGDSVQFGVQGGGAALTVQEQDGSPSVSNTTVIKFSGANVINESAGVALVTMSSSQGSGTDEKVKVTSNDTTANYLLSKLVAGSNITLTENNDGGNETITLNITGGTGTGFSGVALYYSTTQTVSTSQDTAMFFDSEHFDSDGYHSTTVNNHSITIPAGKAGTYLVGGTCFYDTNATGARLLRIRKNNSTIAGANGGRATADGDGVTLSVDYVVSCVEGDRLELITWQNSGGNRTIGSTNNFEQHGFYAVLLSDPTRYSNLIVSFGDGVSTIPLGHAGFARMPYNATIVRNTLLANMSGSLVVDIWKDNYTNFPPSDADTICFASPPTITNNWKSQDTTLSNWTVNLSEGDILAFRVESASTITQANLELKVQVTP